MAADLGAWMHEGLLPADGLRAVKDCLLLVRVSDCTALGAKGRPVVLGKGVGALGDFFLAAYQAGLKPLSIVVESAGTSEADLLTNLTAFERVMWPAMAERVRRMVASEPGRIRGSDRLSAADRQADRSGGSAPGHRQAAQAAQAARDRPPDVFRAHHHPARQLAAGADWRNRPAPSKQSSATTSSCSSTRGIKEFDAVYLNNVCGMVHNDPAVREGLLRFVREGGGLGGHHAVTFANNNWPEFADMMGGWAGAHHLETQMLKVDDVGSPLTKSFGTESFAHLDEFYVFPPHSPYSRAKQRVLLSIDVERSDRATANRFCAACTRPDQDYGVAWIKEYGKGRTYFTPLGHSVGFYTDRRWTEHLLAAIQYLLGDLPADAKPIIRK